MKVSPPVLRALLLGIALAVAAGAVLLIDRRNPPDLALFIGRFHPIVVHLPIGLILLAGALELVGALHRPLRVLRHAVLFVLVLAAISATAAVAAGYLLSLEGGYDQALLSTHMWLGIAVAVGAVAAALLKIRVVRYGRGARVRSAGSDARRGRPTRSILRRNVERTYAAVLIATVSLVVLAGHQGGTLTRGPGYLTHYMPVQLRSVLGLGSAHATRLRITHIDSAYVYQDLVLPVFRASCASCHGASRVEGGLRLDTPEAMMEGGDDGAVIVAGDPDQSELIRRITMTPSDDRAMPPGGARPLDIGQTELIRWWIANGASTEQRVAEIEDVPTSVATLFNRIAPPREEGRGLVYSLEAGPADAAAVAAMTAAGFTIGPVARDIALLQVTAINIRSSLDDDGLQLLLPVAEQVTWLDLAHTSIGDRGLAAIAELRNLTRLNLSGTAVGDDGLEHLRGLENLEYLNLYGSQVTDAGLEYLHGLDRLRRLYLWQTPVTGEGVDRLRQARPDLQVIVGQELGAPD